MSYSEMDLINIGCLVSNNGTCWKTVIHKQYFWEISSRRCIAQLSRNEAQREILKVAMDTVRRGNCYMILCFSVSRIVKMKKFTVI